MAHRTAPLSELGRLRLARAIVDQGWPVARTAEQFQVSRPTAHRWATRLDVKKLANIPAGGGHRFLGRAAGGRNRQADRSSGQTVRVRLNRSGDRQLYRLLEANPGFDPT